MTFAPTRPADPVWSAPLLTVTTSGDGPVWTVVLCGDLNAHSAAALQPLAGQIGVGGFDQVVVDISELRSIDSIGRESLQSLGASAESNGARLVLSDRGVLLPSPRRPDFPTATPDRPAGRRDEG